MARTSCRSPGAAPCATRSAPPARSPTTTGFPRSKDGFPSCSRRKPYPTRGRYTGLGRAFAEVSRPSGVEFFDRRQHPPVLALRRGRRQPQRPAELGEQFVAFSVVARRAARHAVLPGVIAPAAARHHVVNGVGLGAAVCATEAVTVHQRR